MKKIISGFICLVFLLALAACGNNDYIGEDKAKSAAVKDIGAAVEDVEFAINDLITDDGGDYYHVKFTKDGTAYEYKIDAKTGEVISKQNVTGESESDIENGEDNSDSSNSNNDSSIASDSTDNSDDTADEDNQSTTQTQM